MRGRPCRFMGLPSLRPFICCAGSGLATGALGSTAKNSQLWLCDRLGSAHGDPQWLLPGAEFLVSWRRRNALAGNVSVSPAWTLTWRPWIWTKEER